MVGGEALRAHHVGSNVAGVFDIPSYGCADCDLMFCSSRALSQHVALSGHVSGDDASLVRYHEGEEHLSSPFSEDLGHSYSWLTSLQEELEAHAGDYSDTDFDYMMYGSDYDSEGEQMGTGCSQVRTVPKSRPFMHDDILNMPYLDPLQVYTPVAFINGVIIDFHIISHTS
jgi:hypothetical protein